MYLHSSAFIRIQVVKVYKRQVFGGCDICSNLIEIGYREQQKCIRW